MLLKYCIYTTNQQIHIILRLKDNSGIIDHSQNSGCDNVVNSYELPWLHIAAFGRNVNWIHLLLMHAEKY